MEGRVLIPLIMTIMLRQVVSIRCYTDLKKTKSLSTECGLNTACVKILKKSEGFDEQGIFIPLNRRSPEIILFRGCFLVKTQDTCYNSLTIKLSYCWCNNSDLCNSSPSLRVCWTTAWIFITSLAYLSCL
eukprot:GFUD01102491.1.p1 GENE.GFUD01102491.1~~GFUD01102491.1.p1  ORF type:complete len:130 (+),score=30.20 GFUD01102491.1:1-390(+)